MKLENIIKRSEFHKKYGGQMHRISTPALFPYIYLFCTEEDLNNNDSIRDDIKETDDNIIYFKCETNGDDIRGNKAIHEHYNRKGIYHSLLLYKTHKNKPIEYMGEYIYVEDYIYKQKRYFKLNKIEINECIYYIDSIKKDNNVDKLRMELIKERNDYFEELIYNVKEVDDFQNDNKLKEYADKYLLYSILHNEDQNIMEGHYVDSKLQNINITNYILNKYDKQSIEANGNYILAIQNDRILKNLQKKLNQYVDLYTPQIPSILSDTKSTNIKNVIFYCVNVGCALSTFIILEYADQHKELWCADSGIQNQNYKNNVEKCLKTIDKIFKKKKTIDKLFISHPHMDHINCIPQDRLQNTEVWMNIKANSKSPRYIQLINEITKKTSKFVQFKKNLENNNIIKILRAIDTNKKYKMNDLSPIILLNFDEVGKIILTGDIEKEGWTEFVKSKDADCWFMEEPDKATIYVHSHHGSENGICPKGHMLSEHYILSTKGEKYSEMPCEYIKNTINQMTSITTDYEIAGSLKEISYIKIEFNNMFQHLDIIKK